MTSTYDPAREVARPEGCNKPPKCALLIFNHDSAVGGQETTEGLASEAHRLFPYDAIYSDVHASTLQLPSPDRCIKWQTYYRLAID
jgi:hypothetical protein